MASIQSYTAEMIQALINEGSWPPEFAYVFGNCTAIGNTVPVDVTNVAAITVHMKNVGTVGMGAGTFVFEGSLNSSDGADGDWFAIQLMRTDTNQLELSTAAGGLAAATARPYAWKASVSAYKWFRVRTTVAATTNSNALFGVLRAAEGFETIPGVPTHAVSGSGTFLIGPANGTNYSLVGAASINAVSIKSSGANLSEISVFNPTAALVYVKLFDKASIPAPSSDSALCRAVIAVDAGESAFINFGVIGKRFASGVAMAITASPATNDTTVVAAGVVVSATHA